MSHKVMDSTPRGWTPLHCLCHGSDVLMGIESIVRDLLEHGIVKVADFDSTREAVTVSVFCVLLGLLGGI